MKITRKHNPYNLKTKEGKGYLHEEIPIGYLTAEEFLNFLKKKKIEFTRDDNLGRFCNNNSISIVKIKRDSQYGTTPYAYKKPTENQIENIKKNLLNNNNSFMGRKMLKRKKEKILEIFDLAPSAKEYNEKIHEVKKKKGDQNKIEALKEEKKKNCYSKTTIAKEVSKILGIHCNRKLVSSVLNDKRSNQIGKLLKIK